MDKDTNEKQRDVKLMQNLGRLFLIFFKAGTFTFAGGLAMLPVIEKDIVERYQMMRKDEFLEYATLSQTLPGVIALNCACFVGRRVAGFPGMIAAGIGSTISAFVLMILVTIALLYVPQTGPAVGAMSGIRAASAALILSAAISLGKHNIKSGFAVTVMAGAFILILVFNVSTPIVVMIAGVGGVIYCRRFKKTEGQDTQKKSSEDEKIMLAGKTVDTPIEEAQNGDEG